MLDLIAMVTLLILMIIGVIGTLLMYICVVCENESKTDFEREQEDEEQMKYLKDYKLKKDK